MNKNIIYKSSKRITLILMIMILFGCKDYSNTSTLYNHNSFTPTTEAMQKPTEVNRPQKTTPITSPKTTQIINISPSPLSTLDKNQVENKVSEFLSNNAKCKLPCIWGFNPGETDISTVLQFFPTLGWGIQKFERENGYVYYTGKDINSELQIRFGFYGIDNKLEGISLGLVDPLFYGRDKWLSIYDIFEKYGEPDQIWVSINLSGEMSLELHESAGYEVYLFYKNPLILIIYHGFATHINNSFSVCLISKDNPEYNEFDGIRFIHVYTGSNNMIATPTRIMEPFGKFNGRLSVKDAFNMSIQQFQDLILTKDDHPCLSTPDYIWEQ